MNARGHPCETAPGKGLKRRHRVAPGLNDGWIAGVREHRQTAHRTRRDRVALGMRWKWMSMPGTTTLKA